MAGDRPILDSDQALFDRACAGAATEEDIRRLEDRLLESADARAQYLRYAAMHADLYGAVRLQRMRVKIQDQICDDRPTPESLGRLSGVGALAALAAGLLVMAMALTTAQFDRGDLVPEPAGDASARVTFPEAIGSIVRVIDVAWSPEQRPFAINDLVCQDDVLAIESGVVELAFRQGAVAILEGPAMLVVHNENYATLHRGNLAAVAPPWAKGFRIDTPKLHVIDHGTRFTVRVDDASEAKVVVDDGEVEVFRPDDRQNSRRLFTGAGVRTEGALLEDQAGTDSDAKLTSQLPNLPGRGDVVVVGDRWRDWRPGVADQPRRDGPWRHFTNVDGPFGDPASYQELLWNESRFYVLYGNVQKPNALQVEYGKVHRDGGHPGQGAEHSRDGLDHYSITAFIVPEDGSYRIEGGWLERPETKRWNEMHMLDVSTHVNDGPVLFRKVCDKNCYVAFSGALGELRQGDTIYIGVGPGGVNFNDRFRWGFYVVKELKGELKGELKSELTTGLKSKLKGVEGGDVR